MPQGSAPRQIIYEYIKSNTKDGRLPEGFDIPWLEDVWAPGAQDGVALQHMVPIGSTRDPERDEKILKGLKLMASENNAAHVDEVFAVFGELDKKDSIVRLFDPIVRTIASRREELDLMALLDFGDFLICNGTSLLAVKLGLNVLAPFSVPFVEEVAMEFGVYDEFTYYAARILGNRQWPNGNAELFDLAKNVRGWGRIHAVEWLVPATQEIRDWLLFEGADNTVIPQYSADICLQKAEAEKRLEGQLTEKEYYAIENLIRESLTPGGPCPGVTDGDRLLPKFIEKAAVFPPDTGVIRMILDSAAEYGLDQSTIETAKKLAGR
ncbi:MAG: hypothetical protein IKP22_09870 [Clostridia bacterium]|nr:hypothetical protein [Clostridia bacterium]